jgi:murein DD-endopeptidase MepM/ murein hydrolase activator NlpD
VVHAAPIARTFLAALPGLVVLGVLAAPPGPIAPDPSGSLWRVQAADAEAQRHAPGCDPAATIVKATRTHPPRWHGVPLPVGTRVYTSAVLQVPKGGRARLVRAGQTYVLRQGRGQLMCRGMTLVAGRAAMRGPGAVIGIGRTMARLDSDGRITANARARRFHVVTGQGAVTSAVTPRAPLHAIAGDVVLLDRRGLPRLSTWPFAKAPEQRRLNPASVPAFWDDGAPCSVGCRPPGALDGWPLKPFHAQHPLRSGLNELRPANLHIGIDIQALDGTPVYAVQSGIASLEGLGTVESRVIVGNYEYWHVQPLVQSGQYVRAHQTVIGRIIRGAGHLHLSEVQGGAYLNPLRPGGRVLAPYSDTEEPVIGAVRRDAGTVDVEVFDPQSFRQTIKYRTPVLAPAAVAWRARDAAGRPITPLTFAYRGSQHYPSSMAGVIYGPGTTEPDHPGPAPGGWACFWRWVICVPRWNYRLPGVPVDAASVSVYAWDWAGNVAMRTSRLGG